MKLIKKTAARERNIRRGGIFKEKIMYTIMNTSDAWIEVANTKECGISSTEIIKKMSVAERNEIINIVQWKKQKRQESFFVLDREISRRVFAGFYNTTDATF